MRKLKVLVCLVALGGVLGMIGVTQASAGHDSEVTSYTGCLKSGKLENVRAGDDPAGRCVPPAVPVHFSGGDITAVLTGASSGLQGGSANGSANLAIAPSFRLPQGCAAGDVAEYDAMSGTWTCATDDGATYTAGTGLDLVGNEFSIEPGFRLPVCDVTESPEFVRLGTAAPFWGCSAKADANQSCPTGQFANAVGSTGSLLCAAASAGSGSLTVYRDDPVSAGIPDDSAQADYAAVTVPAGTYLVTGNGMLFSEGDFEEDNDDARCWLSVGGAFARDGLRESVQDRDGLTGERLNFNDVVTTAGTTLSIRCVADFGADGASIEDPSIIAVRIG